ncbi:MULTISPECIES: AsmA-like C-terminal region-containing protein [unclassified Yoonia]|uniref:AsmA-like C-terminal region-containing protein n=1 Tax=unclassified Yoonia TaxID=2629118 RepID=UPI002AFF96FB|nr:MULTISPECIES: AsmA-like C-terminal region-containing protein [unclassified Yoonia]
MPEPTQDQPEGAAPVRPKRRLRRGWLVVRGVLLVCLMPLVFALAAAIMVIDRDITAPSWVTDLVQDRGTEVLDGGRLRFAAISVRIGRDLHPTVRLIDTQLIDRNGALVTRIPVIEADVSPRGVIFQRDVLVQHVRIIGAQINLRRARDGSLRLALGAGTEGRTRTLPEWLDEIDLFLDRPVFDALRSAQVSGLIVNYDDARARRNWTVDGGQVALDMRGRQVTVQAELALLSGRADVTTALLSYASPRDSRAAELAVSITNIEASDIAAQSPALNWLRDVTAPLSAELRTELDEAGALGPLQARLEIGAGVLQPTPAAAPVAFSAASADLSYDPIRDLIRFSDIAVQSEWGSLHARGDAYLRDFADGLPRALLAQFQLSDVALNPPGLFDVPPLIDAASVDLRLRLDPFVVDIGQAVVMDGASRMMAQGRIAATDAGWQMGVDTVIDQISPARLRALWPNGFRPGTRDWFTNNVRAGQLTDLHFGLRLVPGLPADVAGHFSFDEASVLVMRDLPPVAQARGTGHLIEHRFVIAVDEGTMTAPHGGPVAMDGTAFAIEDLRQDPSPATLMLQSQSSLPDLLSVINQPPFTFMDRANLPVTIAEGTARATGTVTWPLQPRAPREAVRFDVDVDLAEVRSDLLLPGRILTAAAMQVAVDDAGLSISGPVQLDGVAADANWTRAFAPGETASRLLAEVTLSEEALRAFDIALPPGMISGQGRGQLQVDLQAGAPPRFVLTSDLAGLRVAVPAIGWAKAPGTTGDLRVEGTLGPVPEISRLTISGGGLQAEGRLDLAPGGGLTQAVFSRVRIGDWLDAPITLRGRGAGQALGVEVGGGMIDLRRARFGGGGGAGGGPVQIRLDRLVVTGGITLNSFRGDFTTVAGFTGQFSGAINGAAAVTGTVAPRDGRSAVRLRSDDAGSVLQAAGFFRTAIGGTLDLTLLPAGGEGTFDGTLAVRSLRVRDAPTIAGLLDAISVVGLLQQLDGQGLAFDEVDAQFRLTPDQVIVTQASAVGPGLGISVDGIYTLASKGFDLQGVVSPFYLVNSIGAFLTRKGEGLIGFNFTIAGTSDAPRVSVNPLSALTPGMFREIFRRPPPELTQ